MMPPLPAKEDEVSTEAIFPRVLTFLLALARDQVCVAREELLA